MIDLLHGLLDEAASRFGPSPAISCGGRTLSYSELEAASHGVGRLLLERGVRRGDRVVVLLPPSPVTPPILYACARIGAAFVILHEQVRGAGLAHVLSDAEPRLLVTGDEAALAQAKARGVAVATPGEIAEAAAVPGPPADPAEPPLPVDPVCLIYTSGSTGMPKAVVSTHAQMVYAARAIQARLAYRPGDVVFCALPLAFDYGLYQLLLAALGGAHVQLRSAAQAGGSLARDLCESGATVLPAVPSLAQNLALLLDRLGGRPPALRLLTNTGAAMNVEVLATLRRHIPGMRVQLMFGLTECKRATIMPPDEDLRRPGACGLPLPGTEVFVVGDDGRRLPAGEIGEIVVRGPNVMAGYWRRPGLTEARFLRAEGLFPELRTGDYGRLDADGYLYFAGRRDDVYKERGFRVSATEVETAAQRVPGVRAAAVLPPAAGRPDAVLVAATDLPPHEVLRLLRGELEPYKVPARCLTLGALPLNGNGKTDKRALAEHVPELTGAPA
ncbi:class I adenylate-forming enzyme family protein [Microbispora sp. CA-135349]|uniref:class I adenylate-forming enzyme family protein n=1 Tax=Microbispora sp. CA-135349 TaxID=3239953 RepID=UPI003D940AF7